MKEYYYDLRLNGLTYNDVILSMRERERVMKFILEHNNIEALGMDKAMQVAASTLFKGKELDMDINNLSLDCTFFTNKRTNVIFVVTGQETCDLIVDYEDVYTGVLIKSPPSHLTRMFNITTFMSAEFLNPNFELLKRMEVRAIMDRYKMNFFQVLAKFAIESRHGWDYIDLEPSASYFNMLYNADFRYKDPNLKLTRGVWYD